VRSPFPAGTYLRRIFPEKIIMRSVAVLIVTIGVWGSFDRDMFSKLFQGFSFDYWDLERPVILFLYLIFRYLGKDSYEELKDLRSEARVLVFHKELWDDGPEAPAEVWPA
jgi:hypothetical protein